MKSRRSVDPSSDEEFEALICDCLDLLLSALPPQQAIVVRAIDLGGTPPQVVADSHGLSLNEVTRHLVRGRQGLKNRIGEMHGTCPKHGLSNCDGYLKDDAKTCFSCSL